jgi:xanthine dehydrogenase accessory factor
MDIPIREGERISSRPHDSRDEVLSGLASWMDRGERCALVTLVGVDGNAPRAEGAQMAVSESGNWSGYISGGCLEQAIATEAAEVIKSGEPRLLRYGKGSPYFDIRLPCGSGLDVLLQPFADRALLADMLDRMERRQPFGLRIDVASGRCAIETYKGGAEGDPPRSRHTGAGTFLRHYMPTVRCIVIGSSPIAGKLAELAACAGFETIFYTPDAESLPAVSPAVTVRPLTPGTRFNADRWTAAVLAFHDHDQEMPVFAELLNGPAFYIGAIGSRNAQMARVQALSEGGYSKDHIARIQSPAGLVAGLKSAPLVALSILSQLVAVARDKGIVS